MNVLVRNLLLLFTISVIIPQFSTTALLTSELSDCMGREVLIFTDCVSQDLLDGLGVNIIEQYDDFVMARLSSRQSETLKRCGVHPVEMKQRTVVHINGFSFDIMAEEPDIPYELRAGDYEPGQEGLYIVHLKGPIKEDWTMNIQKTGTDIINYIPNYAYEVRMTLEEKERVETLPFVDAIALYHPAYKISPDIDSQGLSITLMASPRVHETFEMIYELVDVRSVSQTSFGYLVETIGTDAEVIRSIAMSPDIQYIGPGHDNALTGEVGMQVTGGFCWYNDPDGNPSTPYRDTGSYGAYVNHLGWTGAGVTVAIADGGIGNGTAGNAGHNDFTGRVIGGMSADNGSYADGRGHGTHCAGLIAGDTYNGNGIVYAGHGPYYVGSGMAPNAKLYAEKIFDNSGDWMGANYGDIQSWGYAAGARIHSNSWGELAIGGDYDERDETYDQHVRDADGVTPGNQQMITFVSAGNTGPSNPSVTSPGVGKNVITVGSVENYMPDTESFGNNFDTSAEADNPDQISDFSSRGTADNRIKPDIMAPGQAILSLRSPFAPLNCLYGAYSEDDRYVWCSGTSMACPTAAGGAALIYEWHQTNYGAPPTPAMVKALLVNTALNVGPLDCPNDEYGWGRMYLPTIMDPPAPFMLYDSEPELTTGEIHEFEFSYSNPGEPLKITMAYTDKYALNGDNPTLKNQVNIELLSPSGDVYHGNAFSGGWTPANTEPDLGWDVNQDGYDDRNNVESIFIPFQSLEAGVYKLRVIGTNVPADCDNDGSLDQDYSLVMFNVDTPKGRIRFDKDRYSIESTALVEVRDTDLDTDGTPQIIAVVVDCLTEPTGENLVLTETGGSTGIFRGTQALSATDGAGVLHVSEGDTIRATYNDADNGTGSPAVVYDTAQIDNTPPGAPTALTVDWWGHDEFTLIEEDFSDTYPPVGWGEDDPTGSWNQNGGNAAGGSPPEARFGFTALTDVWRLYAGPIDTSGIIEAHLQWNNFNDDFSAGIVCKIQTSSDGVVWNDAGWSWSSESGTLGPALETLTLDTVDIGSDTFYVSWTVEGDGTSINLWCVDDVLLNYSGPYINNNWLNWTLSPDDGGGEDDVALYNIYRSANPLGPWDAPACIASVYAGTDTYVDPGRGALDGINWWYVVRAEDLVGNEEKNSNAIPETEATPTYEIGPLQEGWNLISTPLSPTNTSVPNVLLDLDGDTNWTILQRYAAADLADPWKTYSSFKPSDLNDLKYLNRAMGVWLYIPDSTALGDGYIKVNGTVPTYTNINLRAGWNLVGYPSITERSIASALAGTGYDRPIEGFNASDPYRLTPLADTYMMKPGEGYWVHVPADTTWVVDW